MIVIDASVMIDLLLQTPRAPAIEARLFATQPSIHASHLLDVEVANAMRRYAANGMVEAERCGQALTQLTGFQLHRYSHVLLLPRVWELRNNLSSYDALYVALAEALNAPLLTLDRRIAGAAGVYAKVELV